MNAFVYAVGLIVCVALGFIAGALVWAGFIGFVAACSIVRCWLSAMRKNGRTPTWTGFPKAFFGLWVEQIGFGYTETTYRFAGGHWRGIGNWNTYEVPTIECSASEDKTP